MDTQLVKTGIFTVLTLKGYGIETLNEAAVRHSRKADARGITSLLMRVATAPDGHRSLSRIQCHCIDDENGINQFRNGQLRLLWFLDGTDVIICSHGFFKNTQKTPRKHINKAISLKDRYFNEKE